jgi:predicted phage terminase large subunit-like protein
VVCMQRLHTGDLSGHLIDQGGYDHICLPMRYEPGRCDVDPRQTAGELLWPSLFDENAVLELEKGMGSLRAAGQLQQRPTAAGGDIFKLEHLGRRTSRWPVDAHAVRYWDTAGTPGGGDWTAGALIGEVDGLFYICDVKRAQVGCHDRERLIYDTTMEDQARFRSPPATWIERPVGLGGESTDRQIQKLAGFNARPDKVTGRRSYVKGQDLPARWLNLAAQLESGNVILVEGPWIKDFVDELLAAPNGAHDDQIVAAAGAFSMLTVKAGVDLASWLKVI